MAESEYVAGMGWGISAQEQIDGFRNEVRELRAENAKLRELVASVWRLFTEHGAVHPSDLPEVDAVRDRMRELGAEVEHE